MAQRPLRTRSDATATKATSRKTTTPESEEVEAMDTVKPSRGIKPPTGAAEPSGEEPSGEEPSADPETPIAGTGVIGGATVAGSAATGIADRGAELSGALDSRIREAMPQAKVSSAVSSTSGVEAGAGVSDDAATGTSDATGTTAIPSPHASQWSWGATIGGGTGSSAEGVGGTDESTLEAVRETLAATGRYDDVGNMSEQELGDAMADEATRAYLGYEGPMDTATAAAWAQADAAAQQDQQMRDYLISEGYDPAEVNKMDSETLALYTQAEAEVALAGGEGGAPSGPGGGPQGGSMNLSDRESGTTQMGSEDQSGQGSTDDGSTDEGNNQGSTDGGNDSEGNSDDDDDDDDDDGDEGATTETSAVTGSDDESTGNQEGSGAAPASSTPHPDHDSYNPAEKAAFLSSKLGAESRGSDMDAIAHARGGGLIVGGDDPGDRAAWFESDLSSGERALAARSVSTNRGGGVTDPVDGDEGAEGLSDVDITRIPNFGLVDPADHDGGGGTPVDPITGLPAPLPGGPTNNDTGVMAETATAMFDTDDDDDTAMGGIGDQAGLSMGIGGASLSGSMRPLAFGGVEIDGAELDIDVDDLDLDI